MSIAVLTSLSVFAALLLVLFQQQSKQHRLSRLVLIGLVMGSLYGLGLQFIFANNSQVTTVTLEWINIVGQGYINLLKMIIMPLVLVSMLAAVVNLEKGGSLGKISGVSIAILLITTAIAALIGIAVAGTFELTASGLVAGARESAQLSELNTREVMVNQLNVPQMLISFIPTNVFADLSGARSTSIISVVIFAVLLGIAARKVMVEKPELEQPIRSFISAVQTVVMRLVKLIMALTPYGIAALMAKVIASASLDDVSQLLQFILASYLAIALMFAVHALLVSFVGVSPKTYFTNIWPVLTFAFSSRSSAATIPLNVETQIAKLGVPPAIANLTASFGATIGQNGCAGIYPAMLAVMVATSMGIDPFEWQFILSLVTVVAVSSFGIAGVGGGATFAALIVLPTMGLPVTIVALLISIEPLLDMARTALNVSGSMTAGTLTSRLLADNQSADTVKAN